MSNTKKENLLQKFRDEKSKQFKKLTAFEFMEVWKNYDLNGKINIRRLFPRGLLHATRSDALAFARNSTHLRVKKSYYAKLRAITRRKKITRKLSA